MAQLARQVGFDDVSLDLIFGAPGENFDSWRHSLDVTLTAQVERLEDEIDAMNAELPPLTSFILPAGQAGGAALHLARAITRRAERAAVAAAQTTPLNPAALSYLNRLSDFLFVAARHVNKATGGDVLWIPGGSR